MRPFIIYTGQTQTPTVFCLLSSAHACHACHAWCVGEPATVLGTCLARQSSRVNSLNWRADKLCTPARVLWTLLVHLWATELHNEPVDEPRQTTDPVKSQKSNSNFRNASKWILFQSCQWSYLKCCAISSNILHCLPRISIYIRIRICFIVICSNICIDNIRSI